MERSPTNFGEGNPEAAAEFNDAEQEFVKSPRGKQKIEGGPHVQANEESELEQAQEAGKARAKNDDSHTKAMKQKRP